MSTSSEKLIDQLNDLIQLDLDAIEAYQAAIERLKDAGYRAKLTEFCGDHERHTLNLGELVRKFGGTPATAPDIKRLLTQGKVVIAGLAGGDHAVLAAMRSNEKVTNERYEKALHGDGELDVVTRSTLEQNLADERRHFEWLSAQSKS